MPTTIPVVVATGIPTPTPDAPSLVQAVLAIKQNIEENRFPHPRPNVEPSSLNTSVNAALRAVTKALPF